MLATRFPAEFRKVGAVLWVNSLPSRECHRRGRGGSPPMPRSTFVASAVWKEAVLDPNASDRWGSSIEDLPNTLHYIFRSQYEQY